MKAPQITSILHKQNVGSYLNSLKLKYLEGIALNVTKLFFYYGYVKCDVL